MIIELAIAAGIAFGGAAAMRLYRKRRDEGPDEAQADADSDESANELENTDEPKKKKKRSGPRGLLVDDVILYADSELWLAGKIELDEEGFALRLFKTPGSNRATWLAQLDAQAKSLALLSETSEVPRGVVPESLPVAGMRLTMRRRGQALVETEGDNLPDVGEKADFAILEGPGGRSLVVVDFSDGTRLALLGEIVSREMLDLLPGGDE